MNPSLWQKCCNKGISIGEARAKMEYEKELASVKARLAKYEAQDCTN